MTSWKNDSGLPHSEYSTGVAQGQTGAPKADFNAKTRRQEDKETGRSAEFSPSPLLPFSPSPLLPFSPSSPAQLLQHRLSRPPFTARGRHLASKLTGVGAP